MNTREKKKLKKNKEQNLRVVCDSKTSNICVNRLPEERRKLWCWKKGLKNQWLKTSHIWRQTDIYKFKKWSKLQIG